MISVNIHEHRLVFERFLFCSGVDIHPQSNLRFWVPDLRRELPRVSGALERHDTAVFGLERNWQKFLADYSIPEDWTAVQLYQPNDDSAFFAAMRNLLHTHAWLTDNVGKPGDLYWKLDGTYWFKNPEDATLFLLRWS